MDGPRKYALPVALLNFFDDYIEPAIQYMGRRFNAQARQGPETNDGLESIARDAAPSEGGQTTTPYSNRVVNLDDHRPGQ